MASSLSRHRHIGPAPAAHGLRFPLFLKSLPALARGAVLTAELAVISIMIGTAIGTVAGVAGSRAIVSLPGRLRPMSPSCAGYRSW